jgi:hypothetical protein
MRLALFFEDSFLRYFVADERPTEGRPASNPLIRDIRVIRGPEQITI